MKHKIIEYLASCPGSCAKSIAAALGYEKSDVNSALYSLKAAGCAEVTSQYTWTLVPEAEPKPARKPPARTASEAQPVPKTPEAWQPTVEQKAVIGSAAKSRLFVEAGPGTGKTDSLVARLGYLTTEGGLSAANVLVLSFSVAAIKELQARILSKRGTVAPAVPFIEIRTFDSFASRLLRTLIGRDELSALDFDQRIERAVAELRKSDVIPDFLSEYRHVLLDEMQDLVGVRADFACRLLSVLKPGFTLFGDSAQGIYDFQLKGGSSQTTSRELIRRIKAEFPDMDSTARFTRNFRAGGNAALEKISAEGRSLLLESPARAGEFLEREFAALASQGTTTDPKIDGALLNQSTCVICRTNGQVMRLAARLNESGVPFRIARDRNDYVVPSWIGLVFFGWDDPKIRQAEFVTRARATLNVDEAGATRLWKSLLSCLGTANAVSLKTGDLREAVTDRVLMPDLTTVPQRADAIQLSTIHRSKGREFSGVIVVIQQDDEEREGDGEDAIVAGSEHKVMFVALTRARSVLRRMQATTKGVWKPKERWIRSFTENGFNKLNAFQVGVSGDVDSQSFAAGDLAAATERQKRLREMGPGTKIELKLAGKDGGCPRYAIRLGDSEIGLMSKKFGWAMWHTLKNLNDFEPTRFPLRITNIWAREISTVVGDISDESVDRSLRTSGIWLGVELEGMGYCNWY